jgi:hypothetical protein
MSVGKWGGVDGPISVDLMLTGLSKSVKQAIRRIGVRYTYLQPVLRSLEVSSNSTYAVRLSSHSVKPSTTAPTKHPRSPCNIPRGSDDVPFPRPCRDYNLQACERGATLSNLGRRLLRQW